MKAEYEQNLQNARTEANQIVARAQKTATARGEEIVGEARAQAAALKQKAEADIAQERKKAVNEVKDEIGGMAMEIASKVVEREIREEDHRDLIDEFIKMWVKHHDRDRKDVRRKPVRSGSGGRA